MDKVYREGTDIWLEQVQEESKISSIFKDATIFLTGATGFLGKLFLEKLLRSSPQLKKVYILVRPKKGKDIEKRLEEMFEGPVMVPLKLSNPNFRNQIAIINGDCSLPDLGMDEADKKKMIEETNFIIHCAATVRFDEKIKTASHINVRAVRDLIEMAKQMKDLKAFLHVSTAFSHCVRRDIDEEFYNPGMDPHKLLDLVEALDEDRLTNITPGLLGEWPNTYVFTKAIAEELIKQEIGKLPIAILRPSIVISTIDEPVKGWIDNFYGPTGVMVGAALGVLRTLQGRKENIAEMIPADYVINAGLAVMWAVAETRNQRDNMADDAKKDETPIYNIVSSTQSPIKWEEFNTYARKHAINVPSELQVWHDFFAVRENKYHNLIAVFLLHTVPGYLVDFICLCLGKEQMMVKGYKKINKFMDVLSYFALREWRFQNHNLQNLWDRMPPEDKKQFHFSMKDFDWDTYFHFYVRGGRAYLLKDPLDTIPKGRVKYWKLFFAHYALIAVLLFIFYKFLCLLCSYVF
ncbi:fatty acyl-CoA reductase wat-like [Coccinella septempunctata]|uniref:fatty acyl-CoA reductase wat-like n=1 Tax=Coccinella septempunctata TaxID=41139 RepID=UPI001D07F7CC|nr:fatty acyl-CoA reductase wat-like [Coccinella septempunctata]XP_044763432.1 fatty acyl-CoA reductase wat-like [Coccinella septempunctata]